MPRSKQHRWQLAVTLLIATLGMSLVTVDAGASLPEDDTFEERRIETLQAVSERYDYQDDYTSCVNLGFSAAAMMAMLRLDALGATGGRSVEDAADEIKNLAINAVDVIGQEGDECTWGESGSPATMHGALAFGYILNQWGEQLPSDVYDELVTALEGHWRDDIGPYLVNGNISIVAGQLLGGEALGYDSALWQEGFANLESIYERTLTQGGLEMNSPLYGAYHYAALLPMMDLQHQEAYAMARAAMEYQLMVQAHLYLPGGGLGAPQMRDRNYGGALDDVPTSQHRINWYLAGSELHESVQNIHLVGAVSDYQLPDALRHIFLDKADGYEFWTRADSPVGSRFPDSAYDFTGDPYVAPWQAVVVPGGDAGYGINHGFRFQAIHVSMGVYARGANDEFPILYHYQPFVEGDTTESGGGLPSSNGDGEPGDFVRELYDYERFSHHRSLISIWDPTLELKDGDAVRTHQNTRAHIPDYSAYGGEMTVDDESEWMVGRMSDAYIAYRPLGEIAVGPERRSQIPAAKGNGTRDTEHYYLELDGRSGAIVELATTDEFATIDDYLADLQERHVEFSPEGSMHAEFDARNPDTGETERMRLEYRPEKRFVDGDELSVAEALDRGLIDSPWVDYDSEQRTIRLFRGCADQVVYDLEGRSVAFEDPPESECERWEEAGPLFSDVDYYGDARNWDYKTPERWSVVDADGDDRLYLEPFEFEADGDRLGEYALASDRSFEDFSISFRARTAVDLEAVDNADWVVVFGYQNEDNYYFMIANNTSEYSELFALEDGERTRIGGIDEALVPDGQWHEMELVRQGDLIEVWHDGQLKFSVEDDTYGEGAVGVGTLNDSVLFDDIEITQPGENGGESDPDDGGDAADAGAIDGGGDDTEVGSSGCGCSTTSGGSPVVFLVVALGMVAIRRRNG